MLKKIAIAQVRTGMFVDSVEGPWLKHSLWKSRFLIKDAETLARVRTCGAAECWIDLSQGADVASPKSETPQPPPPQAVVVAAAPEPPAKQPPARKSMADELQ